VLNIKKEESFKAKLKNNFSKKKPFTRFLKGKLSSNKKGFLELEILKGQESYKIKSFTKSNVWALFKSGQSFFKKGELIPCFHPSFDNKKIFF
jgi:molybdopterin molybdotransferase